MSENHTYNQLFAKVAEHEIALLKAQTREKVALDLVGEWQIKVNNIAGTNRELLARNKA